MSKLEGTVEMVIQVCQGFSCASALSSLGYTVKNKGCPRQWLETGTQESG